MSVYHEIYDRDAPRSGPHGWVQWKGTNVCMDVTCECGVQGHVDGDFAYFYECRCGRRYAVGNVVKLIPLETEAQVQYAREGVGFVVDDAAPPPSGEP